MKIELEKYGIQMPAFSKIGGILANELSVDEAACKKSVISWVQVELLLLLSMINTVMVVLDMRNFASKCLVAQTVERESLLAMQEGMATLSSILAWRIPRDRRAWWATVHGVAKSQT